MKMKIKILLAHPITPDKDSIVSLFWKNVIPQLEKYFDVEVFWLTYTNQKLKQSEKIHSSYKILDIHDYQNALEIITEIGPNIIMANPIPNPIEYSVLLSGKYLKIPTIGIIDTEIDNKHIPIQNIFLTFKNIFYSSTESNTNFIKKIKFILYKSKFLMKTQNGIGINFLNQWYDFFHILKMNLIDSEYPLYSKFSSDINFLDNKRNRLKLLTKGFLEKNIIVTGSPLYDKAFKLKKREKVSNAKIQVLLITANYYSHGFFSEKEQNNAIKLIVTTISKDSRLNLEIKIHPSSESISNYKQLLKKDLHLIKIYQKEDILEVIAKSDIILAIGDTSALHTAIIFEKPIIFCDFFGHRITKLIDKKMALECTNTQKLIPMILELIQKPMTTKKQYEEFFIENYFLSDGNASYRIADKLRNLINNKRNN